MRILLIEQNAQQAQATELMLTRGGAVVEVAENGEDGMDLAMNYDYDIVVLSMDVTDMKGSAVLRALRLNKVSIPVLATQSKAGVAERVAALTAGADDHLTKPFAGEELAARVTALVRRSKGFASSDLALGNLVLNLDTKAVSVGGRDIHLTGKEYQVLEILAMRRGTAVTKEMMLNHLYGGLDEPEIKIIDVFICKLRKKLVGVEGAVIETVWGRGYLMHETSAAAVEAPRAARVA